MFALLLSAAATAVADPRAQAEQHYAQQMAHCNSGSLGAPARHACVRHAGNALAHAGGTSGYGRTHTSADGRATIVHPGVGATPIGRTDAIRTQDGRATIIPSADGSVPH